MNLFNRLKKRYTEYMDVLSTIASCRANSICEQHKHVFPKYKGINSGRDVVIVATGESVNRYSPYPDAIHIGVNRAVLLDKIKFDFLFLQDYSGSKGYIEKLNQYRPDECRKFYGRLRSGQGIIPDHQIEKANAELYYTTYPDRAFYHDLTCFPLADFGSVAFSAFHFALWTHPNKIFLVGCDCSSTYFDGTIGKPFDHLVNGWTKAKQFVDLYYPDVNIISINPRGLAGLFEDQYTA